MLTSNLPFSRWEEMFRDPMTTAAAIDRLVHHCVILELNVPSFRLESAQHNRQPLLGGLDWQRTLTLAPSGEF